MTAAALPIRAPAIAALTAAALALWAATAAPAAGAAGTYDVWSCRDSSGAPLTAGAWVAAGNAGTREDTCLTGGPSGRRLYAALGGDDTAPGSISGFRLVVPPGVEIDSYTVWLAAEQHNPSPPPGPGEPTYVAGLGQGDQLAVPTVLDGCGSSDDLCVVGDFSHPLSPENKFSFPVFWNGLGLLVACASANGNRCTAVADTPARTALFRSKVKFNDPAAPTVGEPGGAIAATSPASGTRAVSALVSDAGSGVFRTQLLVDGAVVDQRDGVGACARPFTEVVPCPRAQTVTFALDTTALANGSHTIAVRAFDAAMNSADSPALTIDVDNAPPPPTVITVPGKSPPPTVITVPGKPPPPRVITVPGKPPPPRVITVPGKSPQPAKVTLRVRDKVKLPRKRRAHGTVLDARGRPLAGVRVGFQQRDFGDDRWRNLKRRDTSGSRGRFALPAPRQSKQIRAIVRSDALSAEPVVVDFVRPLSLSLKPSDRRLRNGRRLTLRGRLRHDGGSQAGREALVQARVRGRWRAVDSARIRARGRIRWRYRFTNTLHSTRYRFRLVIPRAKRLPWGRIESRPVSVHVRGARR